MSNASEFLISTEIIRSRHPVLTNITGSVAQHVEAGAKYTSEKWVLVIDGSEVVGFALRTEPWPAFLSPMSEAAATALGQYFAIPIPDLTRIIGPREVAESAAAAATTSPSKVRLLETIRVLNELRRPLLWPNGSDRGATKTDCALVLDWMHSFNEEATLLIRGCGCGLTK